MSEDAGRRLDIRVVQTVQECAETCVDDLLHRLAGSPTAPMLRSRRQALIERTTSAVLRILAHESQADAG